MKRRDEGKRLRLINALVIVGVSALLTFAANLSLSAWELVSTTVLVVGALYVIWVYVE